MAIPIDVEQLTGAFLADVDDRSPGLVDGLFLHGSLCWGEFFDDSDIDFVGVLSRRPTEADLANLAAAHAATREQFPHRRFEGLYCQAADLAAPPSDALPVPVHFESVFSPEGRLDVNLVTWHELAERGVIVRGAIPPVYTDLDALLDFTAANLKSYWKPMLDQVDGAGVAAVGAHGPSVVWVVLGVARLHHLLARRELTSKSGAGRYILKALDERWHPLASDALAIREQQSPTSSYHDLAQRGGDLREFLAWAIDDGQRIR